MIFARKQILKLFAHLVHHELKTSDSLLVQCKIRVKQLEGAYGTVVMDTRDKDASLLRVLAVH